MTTYWKSQDRKFCDFCKCWFADNKVSISFHENGKKHKDNVKKHISQLSKKSAKDFKVQEKIDSDIKKMEKAAMAAYLKDVQNNADITSQNINEMLGHSGSDNKDIVVGLESAKETHEWHELRSDDGNSYFWNTHTNETTWDPPEKFLSIAEQEEKNKSKKEEEKRKKMQKKQEEKESLMEAKAFVARERMKELAVKKEDPKPAAPIQFGPAPCSRPYGSWKPVNIEPAKQIDLQLPKPDKEAPLPPVIMEPERIQFKEKRIGSLGEGPVEFKKRKFNNSKRNMRQKLDDD